MQTNLSVITLAAFHAISFTLVVRVVILLAVFDQFNFNLITSSIFTFATNGGCWKLISLSHAFGSFLNFVPLSQRKHFVA